jgi:hypothetical protein
MTKSKRKYIWTLAGLELARKQRIGRAPWNKGKHGVYSSEMLKRMSDVHKKLHKNNPQLYLNNINFRNATGSGPLNPHYNKPHSEYAKNIIGMKQHLSHERKRIQKQNRSLGQKRRRLRVKLSNSAKAAWERRRGNNST